MAFVGLVFIGVSIITLLICSISHQYINNFEGSLNARKKNLRVFSIGLIAWLLIILEPLGSGYFAFDLFLKVWGNSFDSGLVNLMQSWNITNVDMLTKFGSGEVRLDTTLTSILLSAIFVWYLIFRYSYKNISGKLFNKIKRDIG